jgi:putative hydrolase of the HAD superfamily
LSPLGLEVSKNETILNEATGEFCREFKRYVRLDPEAVNVLKSLSGKYKIGLISNLTFSECARELLEESELTEYFNTIVVSGDVNARKPHPEIFKLALNELGVPPCRAVFVGDNLETDMSGSKNLGMFAIHMRRKPQNSNVKPCRTITGLNQLLPILNEQIEYQPNDQMTVLNVSDANALCRF